MHKHTSPRLTKSGSASPLHYVARGRHLCLPPDPQRVWLEKKAPAETSFGQEAVKSPLQQLCCKVHLTPPPRPKAGRFPSPTSRRGEGKRPFRPLQRSEIFGLCNKAPKGDSFQPSLGGLGFVVGGFELLWCNHTILVGADLRVCPNPGRTHRCAPTEKLSLHQSSFEPAAARKNT